MEVLDTYLPNIENKAYQSPAPLLQGDLDLSLKLGFGRFTRMILEIDEEKVSGS